MITLGTLILGAWWSFLGIGDAPPANQSEFVDLHKVAPAIVIDLRYATTNNVARRALYPPGTPAMVRAGVAQRLSVVQKYLKEKGFGLKIWDAYRPESIQTEL